MYTDAPESAATSDIRAIREAIDGMNHDLRDIRATMAAKDDLRHFATKDDLKNFATKQDLERYATKKDLERYATKKDLKVEISRSENRILAYLENMRKDLLDAHHDDLELVKDRQHLHARRISRLEKAVGLLV